MIHLPVNKFYIYELLCVWNLYGYMKLSAVKFLITYCYVWRLKVAGSSFCETNPFSSLNVFDCKPTSYDGTYFRLTATNSSVGIGQGVNYGQMYSL